jgi:hypothetical protein
MASLSRGKDKNKRRRTEEAGGGQDPAAPQITVKLPEGIRVAMGGRKYCKEEGLTGEVVLQYLKSKEEIKEVSLVDVTVQTMTGYSFGIVLEAGAGAQVHVLKDEIKQAEGIPVQRQDLLMLSIEGWKGEQGSGEPLAEDFVIETDCTVALCVASPQGKVLVNEALFLF